MRGHEEAYRILIQAIIEAQSKDRVINVNELKRKIVERAGTIEIAPSRSFLDWLREQEESGKLVRLSHGKYRIKKDIIIMKQ